MQLVYFSHSYRDADTGINEMIEELMISEGMTPSLDPPSDRLNSAKPERHLRSTDGRVAVLPFRKGGASRYILYEIELCRRARRPVLVFVEDVLPSRIIPNSVLGRRFSRRSLLRQIRDHRQALRTLKTFIGEEPPPTYQPNPEQRRCVIIGASNLREPLRDKVGRQMARLQYAPLFAESGEDCLAPQREEIAQAALAVAFVDHLSPQEACCLGAMRGALTPTITFTGNRRYPYDPRIPKEYQPRKVQMDAVDGVCEKLVEEVKIYEEDYLDLKDQEKARRYRDALLGVGPREGNYSGAVRTYVTNIVDMSSHTTTTGNVTGNVIVDSRLDHVSTVINQSASLPDERKQEFAKLLSDLKAALKGVEGSRCIQGEDAVKSVEEIATEVAKPEPRPGFLSRRVGDLKDAAEALKDAAPAVLEVAGRVAAFVSGFGS